MTTLQLSTADQKFSFTVKIAQSRVNRVCYIKQYGDKIEVLQGSSVMSDTYSPEETAERNRVNSMTPLVEGSAVTVAGKEYTLNVRGNFSDLGYLVAA
jgi:hypothetical protein